MKLTKKEIEKVKTYWSVLESYFAVREENKETYIKYGYLTGRIHQMIANHIYYDDKDLDKNKNADEYLREQFGDKFMEWICSGHRLYAHGITASTVDDAIPYETMQEAREREMKEVIDKLNVKG